MPSSQLVTFRMLSVWQPWADFLVADEEYRDELRLTRAGFQGLREPTPPVLASVLTQWDHQRQMAAR